MEFRTELNIKPSNLKLGLSSSLLSIGSCFANTIGEKMKDYKLNILANPFGVIFNPISIFNLLRSDTGSDPGVIENNGMWYSYFYHSDFRAASKTELENLMLSGNQQVSERVQKCDDVIITLGTAWVYRLNTTNEVVANCHKMPAVLFTKELLSVAEIETEFKRTYLYLKLINPKIRFILTVSPVRHIKDTIELNSVSKSILRVACHKLVQDLKDVSYFPSFEIMMDDLRDYRFYKPDMIHPNEVAEEYIWQKWMETLFDEQTKLFVKDWTEILNAINHRPFDETKDQYQAFVNRNIAKLHNLKSKVDVSNELQFFMSKLK